MNIKNLLLYAGKDKKTFYLILDDIIQSNRQNVMLFSILTALILIVMEIYSFIQTSLSQNRFIYAGCIVLNMVIYFIAKYYGGRDKRVVRLCHASIYFFL